MSDKNRPSLKTRIRSTKQNELSDQIDSLNAKKLKNKLAAKRSRDKKASQFVELIEKNAHHEQSIKYLIDAIAEYDRISSTLLEFIDALIVSGSVDADRIRGIGEFIKNVKERGITNVASFIGCDLEITEERIDDFFDRICDDEY